MNRNILVVDDELLLRDVLYDYLTRQGFNITLAATGEKAIELVRRDKFDLALVDIKMVGMSGIEVTSDLKKHDPNLIVIIMTGYPSLNSAVAAIKSGAAEYIVKPFRLEELKRIIIKNLETLDTESENVRLKERIRELENQLGETHEPDEDDQPAPPHKPVRGEGQPKHHHDARNASQTYGAQTGAAKDQKAREQLERLEQLLAEGQIGREDYEKKRKELLQGKV